MALGVVRGSSEPGDLAVKPQLDCWGLGEACPRSSQRLEEDVSSDSCGTGVVTSMPSVLSLASCFQANAPAGDHVSA